jgi:hypothetical protein
MTTDGRAQPAWYADRASPRPPARTAATNVVGDGLRGGSGFLAGLIGGAIGGAFAIAIAKTDTVLSADTNVTYLAIFGTYGAVLGAVLLATNAARRKPKTVIGWLFGGAILGGGVGGLGSLALVRAIVQPVLNSGRDPETAFVVAMAIVVGSLGLCIGVAMGVVRSGGAALSSGIAGAVAGALGGAAYVEIVLFSDSIRTERAAENIAVATLAGIGAVIGLVIGAFSPTDDYTRAVGRWYRWPPMGMARPSAITMPVVRWRNDDRNLPPIVEEPVVAPPIVSALPPPGEPPPPPTPPMPVAPPIVEPLPVAEPSPCAASGFALRLDDGRTFAIDGRVIVGRDPQRRRRDDEYAKLVSVADHGRTVSDTHIAVTWQDDRLFVEDRGSVNGSAVISPAGLQIALPHATPTQVGDGWTVVFGACHAHVSRI